MALNAPGEQREEEDKFGGEGRSRQEDVETSCRPGWAQPKQTPSPFFSQPCRQVVVQVRSCSEVENMGEMGMHLRGTFPSWRGTS